MTDRERIAAIRRQVEWSEQENARSVVGERLFPASTVRFLLDRLPVPQPVSGEQAALVSEVASRGMVATSLRSQLTAASSTVAELRAALEQIQEMSLGQAHDQAPAMARAALARTEKR